MGPVPLPFPVAVLPPLLPVVPPLELPPVAPPASFALSWLPFGVDW